VRVYSDLEVVSNTRILITWRPTGDGDGDDSALRLLLGAMLIEVWLKIMSSCVV
jgi:hypothetical protein